MIKRIILYLFVSLLFGGIFYYLANNLIFSIVVLLIFIVYFLIIFERQYRKYTIIIRKTRECVNFINDFVITISINNSLTTTLNSLSGGFSDSLIEQINSINQLSDEEKVFYLDNYFENHLYSAFIKILKQFLYEGGNIIDSSHILIFDSRIIEENLNNYISVSKKRVFQFYLGWILCFTIMIAMHIFLGTYYIKIQKMNYFPYGCFIFFVFFLICQFFLYNHYFDLSFINREIKNENNKK